jgi:hypothetical protein
MLRAFVVAIGALSLLGGLVLLLSGDGAGWGAVAIGALFLAGTLFERVIYKPVESGNPGPGWERTTERFYDEERGKTVTVYIHPETGERRYVED